MDMNGKVVIIFGATGGIGSCTAVKFASFGASLMLSGRNESVLDEVAEKCRKSHDKVVTCVADITMREDIERVIETANNIYGKIDTLVNCAGAAKLTNVDNWDVDGMDWFYDICLRPAFIMTKTVTPHLEKTKGNIVLLSTQVALRPLPMVFCYSVIASALDHFVRCAVVGLGAKGIRINTLNPATTKTKFHENAYRLTHGHFPTEEHVAKHDEVCASMFPLRRMGTPEEAANCLVFMSSDAASIWSGVNLPFDGGFCNTSYIPK